MFHSSSQSSIADSTFNSRLGGTTYTDVLHIYGMTRAGYIPQMFSLRLPNPIVIFELLQKTGARALVCEPSFSVDLSGCPVLHYLAIQVRDRDVPDVVLPPLQIDHSASDLVFIFHTSGSTSGSPKLVPCNRRWVDSIVGKSKQLARVRSTQGQDVAVAMYGDFQNCLPLSFDLTFFVLSTHSGSMCHMTQTLSKRPTLAAFNCANPVSLCLGLIGFLYHGSCTIQPTSLAFSSEELLDMITRCGLNRLNQLATFLGQHLRNSKTNPRLLQALVQLDEVHSAGLALGREEEAWALQNGIDLRVSGVSAITPWHLLTGCPLLIQNYIE